MKNEKLRQQLCGFLDCLMTALTVSSLCQYITHSVHLPHCYSNRHGICIFRSYMAQEQCTLNGWL